MRINDEDIKWMRTIVAGREGEVPSFNVSRLFAFQFVEEAYECLKLTDTGRAALRGGPDTRLIGGRKA